MVVDATGAFANKNAGTAKTVHLNSTYAGADLGNYNIVGQDAATADIFRANLLVDGITAQHKVYNGNTVATLDDNEATYTGLFAGDSVAVDATIVAVGATLAGLVTGDQLSVSATGSFEDSNFGLKKQVS